MPEPAIRRHLMDEQQRYALTDHVVSHCMTIQLKCRHAVTGLLEVAGQLGAGRGYHTCKTREVQGSLPECFALSSVNRSRPPPSQAASSTLMRVESSLRSQRAPWPIVPTHSAARCGYYLPFDRSSVPATGSAPCMADSKAVILRPIWPKRTRKFASRRKFRRPSAGGEIGAGARCLRWLCPCCSRPPGNELSRLIGGKLACAKGPASIMEIVRDMHTNPSGFARFGSNFLPTKPLHHRYLATITGAMSSDP